MVLKVLPKGIPVILLPWIRTDIYKPSMVLELESVRLRLLLLRSIFNDVFFGLFDFLRFRGRCLHKIVKFKNIARITYLLVWIRIRVALYFEVKSLGSIHVLEASKPQGFKTNVFVKPHSNHLLKQKILLLC